MSPRKRKMKQYTIRVEMGNLCCSVWREVAIPSILVLHDVYRIILEAFGWDDESCYQFQFKKGNYFGGQENNCSNEINWYLSLESKPVGSETLEEVLGKSKVFNLIFVSEDLWTCHATVAKKESVDIDLFTFECLAGEGACPSSLFERTSLFNEAYLIMTEPDSDPDAKEEVDAFLKENDLYVNGQWPGEFDLGAANKRLDDLKERIKDEIKEFLEPSETPEEPFFDDPNCGIPSNWINDWMEEGESNDNAKVESDDKSKMVELSNSLFDSLVELCQIHGIPCDGVDFNKRAFSQFDINALFEALEKSPNPVMHIILDNLKTVFQSDDFIKMIESNSENSNPDKCNKTTQKKTKSKKGADSPKSKKKKSDDKDD